MITCDRLARLFTGQLETTSLLEFFWLTCSCYGRQRCCRDPWSRVCASRSGHAANGAVNIVSELQVQLIMTSAAARSPTERLRFGTYHAAERACPYAQLHAVAVAAYRSDDVADIRHDRTPKVHSVSAFS
jgi:hypothetical protein